MATDAQSPLAPLSGPYREQSEEGKAQVRAGIEGLVCQAMGLHAELHRLKDVDPGLHAAVTTVIAAYAANTAMPEQEVQKKLDEIFAAQEQEE